MDPVQELPAVHAALRLRLNVVCSPCNALFLDSVITGNQVVIHEPFQLRTLSPGDFLPQPFNSPTTTIRSIFNLASPL